MVGLSRVKERIETDLSDVELQFMIDEAQSEIDARFGAANFIGENINSIEFMSASRLDGFAGDFSVGTGKRGVFSCWIRLDGPNNVNAYLLHAVGEKPEILRNDDNKFQVIGKNSADSIVLNLETASTHIESAKWIHILSSWDLGVVGSGRLYISDTKDLVENTFINDNIEYFPGNVNIGVKAATGELLKSCLAGFYFDTVRYLDFDIEENRRLFITKAGNPVNLGSDGSIPTGKAPTIFLNGPTIDWQTNKGSGGGLDVIGSLNDCDTVPFTALSSSPTIPITVFIGDDQDLDGYRTFLDLTRPLSGTIVVTEIDHTTETVVAADDFRVINGGRTLQRLSDGTNPRQFWQRLVKVVYAPVSDVFERDEVIILLVQLGIEYRGLKSEKSGDHASSFMDYATERNALMSRLSPRRGVLMA